MESPTIIRSSSNIDNGLPKSLKSLTPVETSTLVNDAIDAKKKFLEWSQKATNDPSPEPTAIDKLNQSPSKKIMFAALSAAGLINVGLTLAAEKIGLSPLDTLLMWYASFGAPVIEELVFRSRKIPNFFSVLGEKDGIPLRKDKARLATNALFAVGHLNPFADVGENVTAVLNTFGAAGTLNKLSHERGMTASVALHAIWNATMCGTQYLVEGTRFYRKHGIGDEPLVKRLIGNDSRYGIVKKIYTMTQYAAMVGIGIIGVKEMIEDKKLHELFDRLRKTPNGKEFVNMQEVTDISKKLLASPSLDGYKFQAGVELGYVGASLSMPDVLNGVMTSDQYARSQVHKTVKEVWTDPKTLPQRLEKANAYITEQVAARIEKG